MNASTMGFLLVLLHAPGNSAPDAGGAPASSVPPQNLASLASPDSCPSAPWSTRAVGSLPEGLRLNYPKLTASKDGLYVFGNIIHMDDGTPREPPTWYALNLDDGTRVPPPADGFQFLYPRARADATGRLHVVWAEDTTRTGPLTDRDLGQLRPSELWYAVLDPQAGWSRPRLLLGVGRDYEASGEVEHILWGWWGHQAFSVTDRGRAHIAVPTGNRTEGFLTHIHVDEREIHRSRLGRFGYGGALYPSIAVTGDTVYVGYTHRFEPRPSRDWVAVNVRAGFQRSVDGGRTWDPPISSEQPIGGRVVNVHALVEEDEPVVHLIWAQGQGARRVARHAAYSYGAGQWTDFAPLDPPESIAWFRAALDGCDRLHVVYTHQPSTRPGRPILYHARASDGLWTRPIRIHPTSDGMIRPDLVTTPSRVLLFWERPVPTRGDSIADTTEEPSWDLLISQMAYRQKESG